MLLLLLVLGSSGNPRLTMLFSQNLQACNLQLHGGPKLEEKRTGKTKFHFMFWQKTRSIENPGLVKPLRRQANIKFENMTRSEKLGKGYSS